MCSSDLKDALRIAKYDLGDNFQHHLAKVKNMNKFGLLSNSGNELLPCEYDLIGDFVEGWGISGTHWEKVYVSHEQLVDVKKFAMELREK